MPIFRKKCSIKIVLVFCQCLSVLGQTEEFENIKVTSISKDIGDIKVLITQYKPLSNSNVGFYCNAELFIYRDGESIDTILFDDIEPLGGHYGLQVYPELVSNHLVISKYGDYNGRTIIINSQGEVFSTIGGYCFIDYANGYLFSSYYSDQTGLSIFDLNSDAEVFKMVDLEERPIDFFKAYGNRYFVRLIDENTSETSIWEIEMSMDRIMQVDLTYEQLEDNKLESLLDYSNVQIECE